MKVLNIAMESIVETKTLGDAQVPCWYKRCKYRLKTLNLYFSHYVKPQR